LSLNLREYKVHDTIVDSLHDQEGYMRTVFISYRRQTASGEVRALFKDLAARLGKSAVFVDVDNIALGRDFRVVLQKTLESIDLMLVVIDKNWVEAKDEDGRTRLTNPDDSVRMEVESGLKRDILVTPVLVQGARMPAADQLPAEIRSLAYRNGFELTHNRWDSDVNEMIRRLGLPTVRREEPRHDDFPMHQRDTFKSRPADRVPILWRDDERSLANTVEDTVVKYGRYVLPGLGWVQKSTRSAVVAEM
jgi:hypothetical protein